MRYVALFLSALAVIVVALAAAALSPRAGVQGRSFLPLQGSVTPPTDNQQQALVELRFALDTLLKAADVSAGASPRQALFAQAAAPVVSAAPARAPEVLHVPVVTVVLETGAEGKAIVDGRLAHVGEAVQGGLTVESIQIEAVTFVRKNGARVRVPVAERGQAPEGSREPARSRQAPARR